MSIQDDARTIRDLWWGFWPSRVVLTANTYRIFDQLETPRTAAEVATLIGTDLRATELLLNALTALELVHKRGAVFRNARLAKRFLVSDAPHYMGDILGHADALWHNWSGLDEVMRTGMPHRQRRDHGSFIRGMHNIASLKAPGLMKLIGLRGVQTALDLGGGPGTYAMAMAKRGVVATLFDLPETVAIAREIVAEAGVDGIGFRAGDFHVDDIGSGYDLILISQIFHAYGPDECLGLLRKCRAAMNPGGRVVIQEFFVDRTLTAPLSGALFAINMLVNTERGRCYSPPEMRRWLAEAGFSEISETPFGENVLLSGVAQ